MSLKVVAVVVALFVAEGLCFQVAVPSRNMASSASQRSASGRFFNQNMYSKDDSRVRHMTTTLLDNDNSKSEKASAQSEPLLGYYPAALLETGNPAEEGAVLVEPCTKSDSSVVPIPPFEALNVYPQLPFPYFLPIPQPSLPAQILEPVQLLEEVQISSPDSDTKDTMIIVETPPEMPPFPFFPPFYPPLFYPSPFYPPFSPPQFPQQDGNCS